MQAIEGNHSVDLVTKSNLAYALNALACNRYEGNIYERIIQEVTRDFIMKNYRILIPAEHISIDMFADKIRDIRYIGELKVNGMTIGNSIPALANHRLAVRYKYMEGM